MLEPYEGKLSRTVLRGEGGSNTADLLDKPSDLEQREGRGRRQGNTNSKISIFRYITEGTFDSYSWQLIEKKQKFTSQIMTSRSAVRSCEDIDELSLTYAEVKALATGNPYIKEKMDLDIQVSRLNLLKSNHLTQKHQLEDQITLHLPAMISKLKERISGLVTDQKYFAENQMAEGEFEILINGKSYYKKQEAGEALIECTRRAKTSDVKVEVGHYCSFPLYLQYKRLSNRYELSVQGVLKHVTEMGADPVGNLTRIQNLLERIPKRMEETQGDLTEACSQLENAKEEVGKPFTKDQELTEKQERLSELNALIQAEDNVETVPDSIDKGGEENAVELPQGPKEWEMGR